MKKNLYRLLSFAVLATIIISCGEETSPLIKEAQDGIKSQNYDAALTSLNQAILEDSANADAYYYKGVVYSEIATNNPVIDDRKDSYKKMRENLITANNMYTAQGAKSLQSVESELLINRTWSNEHNLGIKYATGDTTVTQVENPLDLSEDHLENAVIINPDSLLSIEVLAEIYRINSNFDKSIETFKLIISRKEMPDAFDYDRLGSLYLQSDRFEDANKILLEGTELYPDSVFLVQKLADSYMNLGNNPESIKVIESLISREPKNPQYHLVLGTQVYNMANEINGDISTKYDEIFELERELRNLKGNKKKEAEEKIKAYKSEIASQEARANELTEKSVSELEIVIELQPDVARPYNTLGIIYQNKAASLFDKRNSTVDNDEAAKIDKEAKDNLRLAMGYYEKATEIEPDNQDYWRSLFQVYTSLGLNEKAEAAMEKAGM